VNVAAKNKNGAATIKLQRHPEISPLRHGTLNPPSAAGVGK
jgi:hypothetical protein